jgi:hypothetical protein
MQPLLFMLMSQPTWLTASGMSLLPPNSDCGGIFIIEYQ